MKNTEQTRLDYSFSTSNAGGLSEPQRRPRTTKNHSNDAIPVARHGRRRRRNENQFNRSLLHAAFALALLMAYSRSTALPMASAFGIGRSSSSRCCSSTTNSKTRRIHSNYPNYDRRIIDSNGLGGNAALSFSSSLHTTFPRPTSTSSLSSSRHFGRAKVSSSALALSTTTEAECASDASSSTVPLAYTVYGSTDPTSSSSSKTRAVIFLHGLLGNRRNFATIATALSQSLEDENMKIYSVDLRNHGSSQQWHASMSYGAMAQDVVEFCRQQELLDNPQVEITLVGHSMGGKVAQAVALLHPNVVDGLVVLDMAPVRYCPTEDLHWQAVCNVIDVLQKATSTNDADNKRMTKRELDLALRPDIPDPALRAFCLTNWDEAQQQWKVNIAVIGQQLSTLAGFDLTDIVTHDGTMDSEAETDDDRPFQYSGDVLMVHGGQSRFVRHSYLPTIQSYFPNHMLTTIRGAGHWLHAEKPQDVISLLEQYLSRNQ